MKPLEALCYLNIRVKPDTAGENKICNEAFEIIRKALSSLPPAEGEMTPEEADAAYDDAPAIEMTEEEVQSLLKAATDQPPEQEQEHADYLDAARIEQLEKQLNRLRELWLSIPRPATPPFVEWSEVYVKLTREQYETMQSIVHDQPEEGGE